jgi:predicted transcriptional regulator
MSIIKRHMRHRCRIEIISLILKAASEDGATRSKIMYDAFLSYNHLTPLLTFLAERGFLSYHLDTRTFKTTEKGLRFLEIYNQISDMMKTHRQGYHHLQLW